MMNIYQQTWSAVGPELSQEELDRANIEPGRVYEARRGKNGQIFVALFRVTERFDIFPGRFFVELDSNTRNSITAADMIAAHLTKKDA